VTIAITGLSHHSCPVDLRERMAFAEQDLHKALHQLRKPFPNSGAVILSTCNRVEIYLRGDEEAEVLQKGIQDFLEEWHKIPEAEFSPHLYTFDDKDAVKHLFRVASSLDSLVVGEGQILGQVHDAYLNAQTENSTDKIISGLFQRAFKTAKQVHTESNINVGKVSVASVAVDLAISIFGDLANKTALVIGSGETGELALKTLVAQGVQKVLVANRSVDKAKVVAEQYGGEAFALGKLEDYFHRADIVISSTAAPTPILSPDDFKSALKQRKNEPMFAIDIAVPRDIDAGVNDLDNVYLYDMDDLEQVCEQNKEARRSEVEHCLKIVDNQVKQFMKWRKGLHAEPTIVSMAQEFNTIRERELNKTLNTLPDLTDKQRQEVEYLSKRIVNNLLQRPMSQIKHEVAEEDAGGVLHLVKRLFGLGEDA
jgi:glutamyl-tRNA reductase